jgi:hypothetical protein
MLRDHRAATVIKWPIRVSLKILGVVALSIIVSQLIGHEIAGHRANGELSAVQWWLYGLILLLIAVVVSATLSKRKPSKLVIHRAVYAAGLPTGVSVVDQLNNATRDGCAIVVDHNLGGLLPNDPASGVAKRLELEYSYGSDTRFRVSRTERPAGEVMRLVLPEDTEVQRLTDEIARTKQETATQIVQLNKQHEFEESRSRQSRDDTLAELRAMKESMARPRIVPVRYGLQGSDNRAGLFVMNDGDPAYDITIPDVIKFGSSTLRFHTTTVARLTKLDGEVLYDGWVQQESNNSLLGDGALFHEMISQHVTAIELPIRYKDGTNRYYISNCVIEKDTKVNGGLAVRFLGQELQDSRAVITTPDSSWVRFLTAYPEIAGPPAPGNEPAKKPQKIRCEFLNRMDFSYKVKVVSWDCGSRGLRADFWRGCLQLHIGTSWCPEWNGVEELHVPPGESFRMWLYPQESLSDNLFSERVRLGNLGTVHLLLNGKEITVSVG